MERFAAKTTTSSYHNVPWNEQHINELRGILEELKKLMTKDGGLQYSAQDTKSGPYQTLEGLLPFLLFPNREEFLAEIVDMARFVIKQKEIDGGYRPYPEYPTWDNSAVDSTAYALYVFSILREFLETEVNLRLKYKDLLNSINNAIKYSIRFICKNRNDDNGWGFIRHNGPENLPSRTYTTALVVAALCFCADKDFSADSQNSRPDLIDQGIGYLLKRQQEHGYDKGGWGFSTIHPDPHPNITAFVVWSLSCTRSVYRNKMIVDKAIYSGIKYILKYLEERGLEDVDENVQYPTKGKKNIRFATHSFSCPCHILIPAFLLSGELGFRDDRIINIVDKVVVRYRESIDSYRRNPGNNSDITCFVLAETAFALTSYYSVFNAVENCTRLFANVNSLYQAIASAEGKNSKLLSDVRRLKLQLRILSFSLLLLGISLGLCMFIPKANPGAFVLSLVTAISGPILFIALPIFQSIAGNHLTPSSMELGRRLINMIKGSGK